MCHDCARKILLQTIKKETSDTISEVIRKRTKGEKVYS
jgi:hypothetical protein